MNTENEKNPIENRKELADEAVDQVTGGGGIIEYALLLNKRVTATAVAAPAPAPAVDAGVAATANAATAPVNYPQRRTPAKNHYTGPED